MRVIVKTRKNTYFTTVPTYFDRDKTEKVVEQIKQKIPPKEKVTRFYVHSDYWTTDEKKQIDYHGVIVKPMVYVEVNGKGLW